VRWSTEVWFGEHGSDPPCDQGLADATEDPGLEPPLVLVVDDYDDTRMLYAHHLRESGLRVIEASNGDEAFTLAVDHVPDAVIMDLSMPKVDGWEATRRMRSHPLLRSVYIIALSALEGDQSRTMAFDVGCDDFVAKPLLPASLVDIIRARVRPKR
jgi:two-component system cell cycle response regulator DivK